MGAEDIRYRGIRLEVRPLGEGWKVTIYRPGAALGESDTPHTHDPASRDEVIAEAKYIVDRMLRSN